MKYLILVSHGQFSIGLKDALSMFVGDSISSVKAVGLQSGEDIDLFRERVDAMIDELSDESELIVLGDIIGGSPLTTVVDVLNQKNKLANTTVLGGMNFPMALNTAILKDTLSSSELVDTILQEAKSAVKQFELPVTTDDDEDEI